MASEVAPWITAAAAAAGACFAIWKWGFEEWLRRRRELATLDGDIAVTLVPADSDTVCVFVESIWNNKGSVPVFLNPGACTVRVYELDVGEVPRAIDPGGRQDGRP